MAITIDDSQLLRLAADPRLRLFPTLQRSGVFGPIVLLAGLLPCAVAVVCSEFDDTSAGWALRALDVGSATQIQNWLEPGRKGLAASLIHQPPLSAWLLAWIVPELGTQHLSNWLGLSLVATCSMVFVVYLLGQRVGASAMGLVATLIVCCHPVVLKVATSPSPAALGTLLVALTVWGFLGHLEGPPQLVSVRMLAGAVAWGFGLLTIGPVAVVLFIPMMLHVWLLAGERVRAGTEGKRATRWWQIWIGMRSLIVFVVTAISFSGWWEVMMLADHGSEFWQSWWTGRPLQFDPDEIGECFWRSWLRQNSLICGWLAVGLVSAIRELRFPTSEHLRRRSQFVLCWWLTALAVRTVFDLPHLRASVLIDGWDAFLLLPTALFAAWGVRTIVVRQTTPFFETILLVSTLGITVWRFTDRPVLGVLGFVFGLMFIALLPTIVARWRRYSEPWKERDWRRLLRMGIVGQFTLHIGAGLIEFPRPAVDGQSLAALRRRISAIDAIPQVTLTTLSPAPESLLFVLRSQWPGANFVLTGSGKVMTVADSSSASTNEIAIEWARREFRLATEFSPNRQITALGDPLRFRDRRLMVYRVTPREH